MEFSPALGTVLESAARCIKPCRMRGSALHACHPLSHDHDHDHVLTNLADRYEAVLDAVEATDGWATSVRASQPPMPLMGSLGGIQAGLRQLRRQRPLETCVVDLGDGLSVVAPTLPETLRLKAYLAVQRNAVRDYLDVVALAAHVDMDAAVELLSDIDSYYLDRSGETGSVLTSLVLELADPSPRDPDVTADLPRYRELDERWHNWSNVVQVCEELALRLSGAA